MGGCLRLMPASGEPRLLILLLYVFDGWYVSRTNTSRSTYSPVRSCATLLTRMVPAGPVGTPGPALRGQARWATSAWTLAGTSAQV